MPAELRPRPPGSEQAPGARVWSESAAIGRHFVCLLANKMQPRIRFAEKRACRRATSPHRDQMSARHRLTGRLRSAGFRPSHPGCRKC
jgi:hypothetical protein